jgi:hypothetical protein
MEDETPKYFTVTLIEPRSIGVKQHHSMSNLKLSDFPFPGAQNCVIGIAKKQLYTLIV